MCNVLPKYVESCSSRRINSSESLWLNESHLGEFCLSPKDSPTHPPLIAVYNGEILGVESELLHASLSGISIKHHQGKCFQERDEESQIYDENKAEMSEYDWTDYKSDKSVTSTEKMELNMSDTSETETSSYEYLDNLPVEGQPLCTLPKINNRNSFWDIHRPELSKLTWGQKYVSAATVIEHLHEHLTQHGQICQRFHTEENRMYMLNKELDEYVRLKVLACPRELPPDEPPFDIKYEIPIPKPKINPKCKGILPEVKIPTKLRDRVFQIDDDDDDDCNAKGLHRSKEEFCLTIGKPMRGPMFVKSTSSMSKGFITPQISAQEEEGYDPFFYNWFLQNGEECQYMSDDETTDTLSFSTSDSLTAMERKPKLIEDEFCRAAGKVDFSDLRCNPDF